MKQHYDALKAKINIRNRWIRFLGNISCFKMQENGVQENVEALFNSKHKSFSEFIKKLCIFVISLECAPYPLVK